MNTPELKIWNTASRSLEVFEPIHPPEVGMYTCGPTVYNPATIGNLRTYVFEDVLKRTLRLFGYKVNHVMNITDVGHLVGDGDAGEDKVEREASRTGRTAWDIAKEYEARFFRDLERLNVERPTETPRATDHIPEQIALIEELEKKGFTYRTSDGIYFDTAKFPSYGALSGQKMEEKEAGARVEVNSEKKQPADFALWKFSPAGEKRHMEWESPWGVGFPGWHIECSAMSVKFLGQPFDIHCGGVDHIPVHHENEIAQTEAATDQKLARYWMHGEFLLVDGRRMGKSEGNAYTLDELITKKFDPMAFRYYCLGTHYRSKLNFTWEGLEGASNALRKLRQKFHSLGWDVSRLGFPETEKGQAYWNSFLKFIGEDLNLSKALAVLWEMLDDGDLHLLELGKIMLKMDQVLGLELAKVEMKAPMTSVPEEIRALVEERQKARAEKDWKKSDELRDQIAKMGWKIEDRKEGYELSLNR